MVFVPFAGGRPTGQPVDVLTGFVGAEGRALGRPVGLAVDQAGARCRRCRQSGLARPPHSTGGGRESESRQRQHASRQTGALTLYEKETSLVTYQNGLAGASVE